MTITTELTEYGWLKKEDQLEVLWDTPENIARAKQKVDAVLNGCRCRTGCRCIGCNNVTSTREQTESEGDDEIEMEDLMETLPDESTDDSESEIEVTEEIDNIMTSIFGEDSDDETCN